MECYLADKHLRTFYVIEKLVLICIYCFLKRGKVCIYNYVKKKYVRMIKKPIDACYCHI